MGVFSTFEVMYRAQEIFLFFFLTCYHLALLFPFKMSYWIVASDFFSQRYGHIKFWHLSEHPYEHSHWLFGAYHFAFKNPSWKFVLMGFDGLWIRIYSQKIDISISKMTDSKWRIEFYEIERFRSLKTLTRRFRNCWLRKWVRKIDILIYKMAGRFKMANWNLRVKQYWSLKFCTWEFFKSLSTNACAQYAKFFLCIKKVNFYESIYWSSINNLKFLRARKFVQSEIV